MRTIQGKLTLAFLVVILVCFLPTSIGAAFIIQKYQERDALESLATIGEPVAMFLATHPSRRRKCFRRSRIRDRVHPVGRAGRASSS